MKRPILTLIAPLIAIGAFAQFNKATYQNYSPHYYHYTIMPAVLGVEGPIDHSEEPYFTVDLNGLDLPTTPSGYTQQWHTPPVSQGNTSTCWCYSTTSFYESEIYRISGKEVKLSEMYTVYWEYVERAKYFVANKGDMYFGEGSETNAVARMMEMYGAVPIEFYTGKKEDQEFHTHAEMFDEMAAYLADVKEQEAWNEDEVVTAIKSILEDHMGEIPSNINVDGQDYTPQEYLNNYLGMKMNEYVNVMSLMEAEYWEMAEYEVPDNWWNSDDYHNVPLDDFTYAIQKAIEDGYTISIGGDVSEAGFNKYYQVAVVPSFDIPATHINEASRQMRFNNGSTTDDHAMHLVGYQMVDGVTWYLIKDSGSSSRSCGEDAEQFGYYFFHEDYIKLKMMTITVHQDAVKQLLKKMKT